MDGGAPRPPVGTRARQRQCRRALSATSARRERLPDGLCKRDARTGRRAVHAARLVARGRCRGHLRGWCFLCDELVLLLSVLYWHTDLQNCNISNLYFVLVRKCRRRRITPFAFHVERPCSVLSATTVQYFFVLEARTRYTILPSPNSATAPESSVVYGIGIYRTRHSKT